MILVNLKSTMISFSNRITGTDDGGRNYDYYRLSVMVQNKTVDFSVSNEDSLQPAIAFLSSKKFGEEFYLTVDLSRSYKTKRWYVNIVGAEAIK